MQKELKTALEVMDLCPSSERFILPIRLDDCEVCERKLKEHHWVDLFPENEYQKGLKKILQVVSPGASFLRSKPMELTDTNVNEMLLRYGFYDNGRNPDGEGINHQYELQEINGDKVVFDGVTGLMWQQSGSDSRMNFDDAIYWIEELNYQSVAGFNDWRLPTLEEAMTLIDPNLLDSDVTEPGRAKALFIHPIFDSKQNWIWTADKIIDDDRAWIVSYEAGYCYHIEFIEHVISVRAVRSG